MIDDFDKNGEKSIIIFSESASSIENEKTSDDIIIAAAEEPYIAFHHPTEAAEEFHNESGAQVAGLK